MENRNETDQEGSKFTFIQDFTDREKYKLTLFTLIKSNIILKLFFILLIPMMIVVFVTFSAGVKPETGSIWLDILPGFAMPVLIALICLIIPLLVIRRQKGQIPVFEFDNWGMTVRNGEKTNNVPWDDLAFYSESTWFVSLSQSKNKMLIYFIPKRAFKNNDEVKSFIDFLIEHQLKRK